MMSCCPWCAIVFSLSILIGTPKLFFARRAVKSCHAAQMIVSLSSTLFYFFKLFIFSLFSLYSPFRCCWTAVVRASWAKSGPKVWHMGGSLYTDEWKRRRNEQKP
jgi:hypothetical protein